MYKSKLRKLSLWSKKRFVHSCALARKQDLAPCVRTPCKSSSEWTLLILAQNPWKIKIWLQNLTTMIFLCHCHSTVSPSVYWPGASIMGLLQNEFFIQDIGSYLRTACHMLMNFFVLRQSRRRQS